MSAYRIDYTITSGRHGAHSGPRHCCVCGRQGTRGFRDLPPATITTPTGTHTTDPMTECAAKVACARRISRRVRAQYRAAALGVTTGGAP